jgi:O-glycosyl hydrolase
MPHYFTTLIRLYRNRTEPESLVVLSRHVWHVALIMASLSAAASIVLGVVVWLQHPQSSGVSVVTNRDGLNKTVIAEIAGEYMKRIAREQELPPVREVLDPSVVRK